MLTAEYNPSLFEEFHLSVNHQWNFYFWQFSPTYLSEVHSTLAE
jgi:hypothetical protein